jgi:hypothetical protein
MPDAVLRPFGFGELLDGSFTLYRRHFIAFFGTALIPQLPLVLLYLVVPSITIPSSGLVAPGAAELLILPYNLFAVVLVWAALTHGVWEAFSGAVPSIGRMLRAGLERWVVAAVASILAWCFVVLGFIAFIVPGLIVLAMFFAIYPAAVLERLGPVASLGRSRRLSKGARLKILGALVVALLITLLPVIGVSTVAGIGLGPLAIGAGPAGFGQSAWIFALFNVASEVVGALTAPFMIGVIVLLYCDRRARTEAPDLEAAAASLGTEAG